MVNNFKKNNNEILKDKCLEHLGGKMCAVCGVRGLPTCCYDFHHKNGNKDDDISKMIARKRILDQELINEVNKCAVLCANCHRQITAGIIKLQSSIQ